MSDRSYLTLIVYSYDESEADAVRAVIERQGLDPDDGQENADNVLTGEWVCEDASTGSYQEIADDLVASAPSCAFKVWNDPAYEYLGGLAQYTPDLGLYAAECNSDGEPVLTASEVEAAFEKSQSRTDLRRTLGIPWREAFAAIKVAEVSL